MNTNKRFFTVRATASRLEKGLLAIPQKFKEWFPREKAQIRVAFDGEPGTKSLTFHPYDPVVKESRIFGLGQWFSKRRVREGDLIEITLEDAGGRLYRIALDRYTQEREEHKTRQRLQTASTDAEAGRQLAALSRLTQKQPREVAAQELLRIANTSAPEPRPKVLPATSEQYESVPSGIRVLLRELHGGKCQLCSFTFRKRNGEPYFEIHHLDPAVGHHPTNLVVVCPNCHAQLEQATVTHYTWAGKWLVSVTINGKRLNLRQPLAHDPARRSLLVLGFLVAAGQMWRVLHRTVRR